MKTPQHRTPAEQREALKQSERKANETHPENFKEEENEDKQVEILPIDEDGSAIRGIDPKN